MYDQGFDCAAFGVTFMYERAQFMRYSAPYLPYKFTVVAPRPTLAAVKYTDVMWTVFSAFSPSCWGVVIASVRGAPRPPNRYVALKHLLTARRPLANVRPVC